MPSGSHGGHVHTGGSHVGGGSSFGGGSYNNNRGHGGFYPRRPFLFWWGHTHYVIPVRFSAAMSLLLAVLVLALFFILGGWLMSSSATNELARIDRDYQRYHVMIADATVENGLLVDGTIQSHYFEEDAGKWYLAYSFASQDGGEIKGESFCVYTWEDLQEPEYKVGKPIKLALDKIPLTKDTDVDSVPTDYGNMPLSRDGAYVAAQNSRNIGRIMMIVAGVVLGISVVTNVAIVFATKKKVVKPADNTATNSAPSEPTDKYCEYCGSKLETDATKCHLCGARVRK